VSSQVQLINVLNIESDELERLMADHFRRGYSPRDRADQVPK
jgi:hypothetical protein